MAIRWGIIGAGKISHDFAVALRTIVESGEALHKLVAVAASDGARAKAFAERHKIPAERALDSYSALAQLSDVDAVYIGTLHLSHLEHARLALAQGKAVLCEKPLTVNAKQARELCSFAQEKGVFLMEALWSRFLPPYRHMVEVIEKGGIGEVKIVHASFGFSQATPVDRLVKKELAGGAILDISIYVLNIALMAFGNQRPEKISACGFKYDTGCDHTVAMTLTFPGERLAHLMISVETDMPNEAIVLGTKGSLKLEKPFWCTTSIVDNDGSVHDFPLPEADDKFNYVNSAGLRFEAEEVRKCLAAGRKESAIMSHEHSLLLQDILDELRRQVGVVMPQD